jgi:hypothetical protein
MSERPLLFLPVIGLLLAIAPPAQAVLGLGDLVNDPPVEEATAAIQAELGTTNTTLVQIQTADALTAKSVTAPGDPGLFQGVNQFLDAQENLLASAGVSAATMRVIFPGWQALQPDNIAADAAITQAALGTYEVAVQAAQNQAAGFDGEGTYLTSIEAANTSSAGVLQAIQIETEAELAVASQVQMERQLMISLITIEALRDAEELNERAQAGATTAQSANGGVPPQ